MTDASFQFVDNDLSINEDGQVNGKVCWNFHDSTVDHAQPWQFVCSIKDLRLEPAAYARLSALTPGHETTIRYRGTKIGPLKKQDPFGRYIHRDLGIDSEKIVGYAWFDGWTEVVIKGP